MIFLIILWQKLYSITTKDINKNINNLFWFKYDMVVNHFLNKPVSTRMDISEKRPYGEC